MIASKKHLNEWLFQLFVISVLFILFSFDKYDNSGFELRKLYFFISYAIYALIIGYVLLPKFLFKKKYGAFIISILIVFSAAYYLEEFVLEKIFYHDKRGQYVSGVLVTLLQIFPIVITMVSFKLVWDASKKQIEFEQLKTIAKEHELLYLKAQIHPHFLFNHLNNLYAHAIEESKKTPSIILELSSVLRYMLYDCKENFVSLSDEVTHLKHYVVLNELQIEGRGQVIFNTQINNENYTIAPLILNVFVENAFKHSTSSLDQTIHIFIDVKVDQDGKLYFSCKNSYSPTTNAQGLPRGIGLENVKKRLEMIYPNKHLLSISASNNEYNVNLEIQLNKL
ncbi:MAG: histidine kinase [Flavobacteriales bacterium]|jgi:hypothetical protein|nr:histidine kinase [Flavobacteriales bacterium]